MKIISQLLMLSSLLQGLLSAQVSLTKTDSLLLESIKNDTTRLRQLTISRKGERVSAMAYNRIAYILIKAKKDDLAEKEYRTVYFQYFNLPEAKSAGYHLGKIAHRKGNFIEAKKILDRIYS